MSHGGGGFGSGAVHSASGSSGSFHHSNQHSGSSSRRYDDPFYATSGTVLPYRQRYTTSSPTDHDRAKSSCCIAPAVVMIVGSLVVLFGIYLPVQMEAGLSCSRILTANRLFVREIEVKQQQGGSGAYVYEFHGRPPMSQHRDLSYEYHESLDAQRHQEWALWLNKGSGVTIDYSNLHGGSVILAVFKGQERFNRWLDDPYDSDSAIYWQRVKGVGRVELVMDEDDDYFFTLGNTNYKPAELDVRIEARMVLYDTKHYVSKCSLQSQTCKVKLSLFRETMLLLTTPAEAQHRMDVWQISASYKTRWLTYIIGYGSVLVIVVLLLTKRGDDSESEEKSPLVPPSDNTAGSASEQPAPSENTPQGAGGLAEDRLCVVCLDAEKDSFFDPCGHCATCYACGVRIKESRNAICPICRGGIGAVRRLFR